MGVIKNFLGNKVYIKPQGFLDSNSASLVITFSDINSFKNRGIKYLTIDFSKVISANITGVRFLNEVFEKLYKNDIECGVVNLSDFLYSLFMKCENRFFNIYENTEVETLFTSDEKIEKDIYLCCIDNEENKNLIIYNLVKKDYIPILVETERDIKSSNYILIKKSVVSKFSNKVSAIVKDNIVYFFLDGFLDASFQNSFDIEYFRRSLLVGFRVFVFNMKEVKGLNIHAVNFLTKLGVESAEYGALMVIIGLNSKNVKKELISNLDVVGYLFFANESSFLASEELKEAMNNFSTTFKKKRKITKEFVQVLPYFVNSTIESIELLTGVSPTKEKPALKTIELNLNKDKYVASSIGFYGDLDGMVVLIFSENLTKRISKILLGEEVSTKEELQDIVSEFANIIVGNTRTLFAKEDIHLFMTLPKTFDDIEKLKVLVDNKDAIEIKFYFEEEEFYFYLAR